MTIGTLITVAPTGAELAKAQVPALPVTLDELVATAQQCAALGASVIHVHVRDDDARPTLELGRLRETVAALRSETALIVALCTTGAGTDAEAERLSVLDAGAELASVAMGTVASGDQVFTDPRGSVIALHERAQERGIVPTYEVFQPGHLAVLQRLLHRYGLPVGGHVHVELVLGAVGGAPASTEALVACRHALRDLPPDTTFSATGIGFGTLPVLLASLSAGGHLRVGMQHTASYAAGQPVQSNAQLVARAAAFARLAQRPPLTPDEARKLLGLTPPGALV